MVKMNSPNLFQQFSSGFKWLNSLSGALPVLPRFRHVAQFQIHHCASRMGVCERLLLKSLDLSNFLSHEQDLSYCNCKSMKDVNAPFWTEDDEFGVKPSLNLGNEHCHE